MIGVQVYGFAEKFFRLFGVVSRIVYYAQQEKSLGRRAVLIEIVFTYVCRFSQFAFIGQLACTDQVGFGFAGLPPLERVEMLCAGFFLSGLSRINCNRIEVVGLFRFFMKGKRLAKRGWGKR